MQDRARSRRWTVAAIYTVLIYTLAWFVAPMWSLLTGLMGTEAGGDFVNRAVPVVCALGLLVVLLRRRLPTFWSYPWLLAVAVGFAYVLTLHAEYPVERIHLIQYGLVAFVYFRALRLDLGDRTSYVGAAVAVFLIGLSDELIQQHLIDGRSGTLEDMIIDWLSGGLGLIALLAIRPGGMWNLHLRLRTPLRFATGLALPLLIASYGAYRVYTDYLHPPLNLLIITVDCARPDFMGIYGNELTPPTTHYLDRVAQDGAVFTQAFSQASWTSPGVMSTMTGMYPPTHGVTSQDKTVPKTVTTLLDAFKEHGYRIPRLSYLINAAPNFLNIADFDENAETITTDNEIPQLLKWIGDHHREPFALWYHWRYMHLPYDPALKHWQYPPAQLPPEVLELRAEELAKIDPADYLDIPPDIQNLVRKEVIIPYFSETALEHAEETGIAPSREEERAHIFDPKLKAWVDALYAAQMREFDHNFEAIRYRLALHHKLDNTIIVITADHGEELLEHGHLGHASTAVHTRHYDEHTHIPLIIINPRLIPEGHMLDVMAQQVDILPTLMDMMGWDIPEGVQGRSLYPAILGEDMEDVPVFAESVEGGYQSKEYQRSIFVRSIRTKEWKFIARMRPLGSRFELYNLVDDPAEANNVYEAYPHIAGPFIQQIGQWISMNLEDRLALEEREALLERRIAATDPANLSVPEIVSPQNGDTIYYDSMNGAIEAEWTGNPDAAYIIEYDVGEGWHRLTGMYPVEIGTRHVFGPLPRDGWKPLYQWNPYKLRVRPRGLPDGWSDWITINVAPVTESSDDG